MSISIHVIARPRSMHVTATWWPTPMRDYRLRRVLLDGEYPLPGGKFTRAQALALIGEILIAGAQHGRQDATAAGARATQPVPTCRGQLPLPLALPTP